MRLSAAAIGAMGRALADLPRAPLYRPRPFYSNTAPGTLQTADSIGDCEGRAPAGTSDAGVAGCIPSRMPGNDALRITIGGRPLPEWDETRAGFEQSADDEPWIA